MRYQSYKRLAIGAGILLAHASAASEMPDSEFIEHARALAGQYQIVSRETLRNGSLQAGQFKAMANQILQQTIQGQGMNQKIKTLPSNQTLVFVTWSMGEVALRELIDTARNDQTVQIVFRGILPGENVTQAMLRLRSLFAGNDEKGGVVINPVLFREYDVEVAPVIVSVGEQGEQLSRISGVYNVDYLKEQIEANGHDDFGVAGSIREIVEPDMIAVLKAQMRGIDWNAKMVRAKKRAWKNVPFVELPAAKQDSRQEVDLSVMATRDITAPDGTVIVEKGTVFNPLEYRKFTQTLVVFNPERASEMQRVLHLKRAGLLANPVYMMTSMNTDGEWDRYQEIVTALNDEVFILTQEVKERFHIQVTPTLIRMSASNNSIERLEIAVLDEEATP